MGRIPIEASTATTVRVDGRDLLFFGGNNYLGLAHHPEVHAALCASVGELGLTTTSSRETTGNTTAHEALEGELAAFLGAESAILTAEGYTANLALAQSLATDHRVALIDEKSHRSVLNSVSAAGLEVVKYRHVSATHAAELVTRHAAKGVLIFTDGVFAADGAIAPARELLGALPPGAGTLVIDDCHGFCVLGDGGRGTASMFGVRDPRLVITTTLAKGLGCYGGCIAGSAARVASVCEHAGVYRGSTPVPPPIAQAARVALALLTRTPGMVTRLFENVWRARAGLTSLKIELGVDEHPILTFTVGSVARMDRVYARLWEAGILAPLIEYPGGPTERYFRLSVNAMHTAGQIDRLIKEFGVAMRETAGLVERVSTAAR